MQMFKKISTGVSALSLVWLIAGCSTATPVGIPAGPAVPLVRPDSGNAGPTPLLAVAGQKSGSVVVFDANYKPVETISGFAAGDIYDDHYDRKGNLYVTDEVDSVVDEYAKGSSEPVVSIYRAR